MKVIKITPATIAKPVNQTGGNWMIRVVNDGGGNVVPTYFGAEPQTPWPISLPPGTYGLIGQRLDTNNNALGPEVSGSYEWDGVGAETVEVAGSIGVIDV